MRVSVSTGFDTRLASFLFAYGGSVHLLMFRLYAQPVDPKARSATWVAIFLIGGIVELALFYRLSHHVWTSQASLLSSMALVGLVATFLVTEVAFVTLASAATLSGWHFLKMLPIKEELSMFGLMVLSVHVYGFVLFFYLVPLGAVQGFVAGVLVQRLRLVVKGGIRGSGRLTPD